jgi:hypothetical protein
MRKIETEQALYIKLGEGGTWERECTKDGTLRLGYHHLSHELCIEGKWPEVLAEILKTTKDKGAATRHLNQVRFFYEASPDTLWITFNSDRLFWCFAKTEVTLNKDGSKIRQTISGWRDKSIKGELLTKKNISGKVLATQGFQGTICSAPEIDYLLHKINGTVAPHIEAAQTAFNSLVEKLIPIIKSLNEKDLETFTDLIFRQAGWSRVGVLGGTEKDIDLDLISPITNERIAVQIKSRASDAVYIEYRNKFSDMRGYTKFYFVTHSPTAALVKAASLNTDGNFIFWGAQELADFSAKNGLIGWLLDKAS